MKSFLIVSFLFSSFVMAKEFRFENSERCVLTVSADNFALNQTAEVSVVQNNKTIKKFSGKIQSLSFNGNSLDTLVLEHSTLMSQLRDRQLIVWLKKSKGQESLEHDNGDYTVVPAGYFLLEGYFAPGDFLNNSTAHYCLGSR